MDIFTLYEIQEWHNRDLTIPDSQEAYYGVQHVQSSFAWD